MNKRLFSNTILYTIGEVVPRIISFLMMPIFTRYLAPADYGILSYTNSVIAFIYVFCTLALNTYVLRFFFDCKSEEEEKKLLGNVFVFIALVNLVVLVFLNITGAKIVDNAHITVAWKPYFRLAVFNNFLESFSIIPLVYYRVKQNAKLFVGISVGRCILQYAVTFIILAVFGWGVMSQYYGRLVTLLPFCFLYVAVMIRHSKLCLDWKQLRGALKFSLPLLPGVVSYLVLTNLDRIILERYVSLEIIGIYNIAYTIAFAMNMVIQSFYKALEPNIFQKYNAGSVEYDFIPYMRKINDIYNFALYALALMLSLFAKEALLLVATESYYMAAVYVPLVLVGVIFSGRNMLINCVLTAEKRSVVSGIGMMIGAAVSIALNLLLVPRIGVVAAPLALSVSYMIMNIYLKISTKIRFFSNLRDVIGMVVFLAVSVFPTFDFDLPEITLVGIKSALYIVAVSVLFLNFNLLKVIRLYRR